MLACRALELPEPLPGLGQRFGHCKTNLLLARTLLTPIPSCSSSIWAILELLPGQMGERNCGAAAALRATFRLCQVAAAVVIPYHVPNLAPAQFHESFVAGPD